MGERALVVSVNRIIQRTSTVRSIELELPEGTELGFQPGQYLDIRLPHPKNSQLKGKWNGFSITSSPLREECVEITVSRRGPFSQELYDLPVGASLEIRGPGGTFIYDPLRGGEPVFIAGGIGITPIMSMLRYLNDLQFPVDALLIYSCRSFEEIIFHPELLSMESRNEGFEALFTLTRSSPPGWRGETRRVDQALLEERIPDPQARSYYICGPQEMMLMLNYYLRNMGVKKGNIVTELW
jgi:ferredoxin-NADP reductase